MPEFQTISNDQALGIIRRHANDEVTLVTPSLPGVSIQITGRLYTQETADNFAFAIAAGENMSVSVIPFADFVFQIPEGDGEVDGLICAMTGPQPDQEVMMWMLRFD